MQKKSQNFVREYFELIVEMAVFVFFVLTFVVQAFQIPSGSMIPKLLIGDFLLVNKMAYVRPSSSFEGVLVPRKPIQRKDIIVFKWPRDLTKDFVKRVVSIWPCHRSRLWAGDRPAGSLVRHGRQQR